MKREILNNFQKNVLKAIGASELGKLYIWTGGTALAYNFKHRLSEDLDFFSIDLYPNEHILAEINKIAKQLKITSVKILKRQNRTIFEFKKQSQNLKIEFVYFPFTPLKPAKICKEFNLKISSLIDLAVNKVFALYERSEPKDVFDLYFLFEKKKYSLDFLVKNVHKKFEIEIDKTNLCAQTQKALNNLEFLKPYLIKKIDLKIIKKEINRIFKINTYNYLLNILMF